MPKAGGVPENLRSFKKGGTSPNPKGRPKDTPLKKEFKKWLKKIEEEEYQNSGMAYAEVLARKFWKDAIDEDGPSRRELLKRFYPVVDQVQQTNFDGGTQIRIIRREDLEMDEKKSG